MADIFKKMKMAKYAGKIVLSDSKITFGRFFKDMPYFGASMSCSFVKIAVSFKTGAL